MLYFIAWCCLFSVTWQGPTIFFTLLFYKFCWCSKCQWQTNLYGKQSTYYEVFTLEWCTLTTSQSLIFGKQGRGKGVITFLCAVPGTTQETLHRELPCEAWQARTTAGAKVLGHRSTLCTMWTTTTIGKPALPQINASMLPNATSKKQNRLLL